MSEEGEKVKVWEAVVWGREETHLSQLTRTNLYKIVEID